MRNAGTLDQLIRFERLTRTSDGGGGYTDAWGPVPLDANVWAHVKAKTGREGMVDGQTAATFVVVFTVYNRGDITALDRIVWEGVAYNIRGMLREGGRDLRLKIEAERGVAS